MRYLCLIFVLLFLSLTSLLAYEPQDSKAEAKSPKWLHSMRYPCWSPDGEWIAFSLNGDIWKVPAEGGQATHLTLHEADDLKPRWSPDGKSIAFSSNRSGNFDIWVVPAEGGIPTQITFHSEWDSVSEWTPDGKWILFFSSRSGDVEIWKIRADGSGIPVQITFDGGRDATVSPDGTKIVYTTGGASLWIKGYIGSGNWDIFTTSLLKPELPQRLTTFEGNDVSPFFSADGKSIYYTREDIMEEEGKDRQIVYNLWKMDIDGKSPTRLTTLDLDIFNPHFSKDGKKVVFEKGFQLWQMSLSDFKSRYIPITVVSDIKTEQISQKTVTEGNEMGCFSPDGNQIAFALENHIWVIPSHGGKARKLTSGNTGKAQWPRFSPDGKSIAYFSNKSGNDQIYILDLDENTEKPLTEHKSNNFFHSWSPDGKTIVFTSDRSGNRDLWLIPSEGGIERQITNSPESEDDAVFSPDGAWIAFDSGKDGNQEIWLMPADGNYAQAKQLTKQGGLTQVPGWSPDSKWIVFEHNDARGIASIWFISPQGGKAMQIATNASLPSWSPDGKWILYESEAEGKKNLYTIAAPQEMNSGKRIPFFVEMEVNLKKERAQVFEEAWSAIDKGFYDPEFHGIDWKKIREKYQPLAEETQTDLDLSVLVNRMVGEIGASHMGLTEATSKNKITTGELGWTLEEVEGMKALRIREVLKDGPADKAWIRKGDYVFQVESTVLTGAGVSVEKALNNTVGKEIKVFISPSSDPREGRYVKVTPVDVGRIGEIQYQHWLLRRIEAVKQISQGKIIYLHLREMNEAYLRRFGEVVMKAVSTAEGMILDVRNNEGGNIHQELLDILMRKPFLQYQARDGKKQYQPALYWDKPVVVLMNEKSFSDAEVFPYAFQVLKRGYVVGVPTSGGVIGTKDITIGNKFIFRVPHVGYYTLDNKNLEGFGVKPDFHVPETAKDRIEDRDPQLAKALQLIIEEIQKGKQEAKESETPSAPRKEEKQE